MNIKTKNIFLVLFPIILFSQDFWKSTNGPYGAYVRTLFVDSTNKIWAGTFQGIYVSSNKGNSWLKQSTYNQIPTNFAINSKGKIFITSYWGIFQSSIDQLKSWQNVPFPGFFDVRNLYIDKKDRIFVGTDQGVYRSFDDGVTWKQISSVSDSYAISEDSDERLYSSRDWSKIYYSTDLGDTWNSPDTMIMPPYDHTITNFVFNSKNEVFGGTLDGVLYSKDKGKTWNLLRMDSNYNYVFSISIDKNDNIYAGTAKGLFISSNNGITWNKVDLGFKSYYAEKTCIDSLGYIYVGLNNSIVIRSSNSGINWNIVIDSLKDISLSSIDIDSSDNILVGSDYGAVYYSSNKGGTWSSIYNLPSGRKITSSKWSSNNTIYVSTNGDGIFKSTDMGKTWNILNDSADYKYVESFFINGNGKILLGTTSATYVSINDGQTWTKILSSGTRVFQQDSQGQIFAGTHSGIYKSNTNMTSWKQLNNGIITSWITSIAIYKNNIVFAGNEFGGIYRSIDNGETWNQIHKETGGDPILLLPVKPIAINNKGIVYISFPEEGFKKSIDSGQTWQTINTWIGNDIAFDKNGYMFTISNGVYISNNSTTTSVQTKNQTIPVEYRLFQNYPNPFNPTTTLSFSIPKASYVQLIIYDYLGREVETLINEFKLADYYKINYSGNHLASGVYFCKLKAGNYLSTKKILLLK